MKPCTASNKDLKLKRQSKIDPDRDTPQNVNAACSCMFFTSAGSSLLLTGYVELSGMSVTFAPLTVSLPLSLAIQPGNTNSVFALDYISGSLTVSGQLDRENPLYSAGFTLTVKVSV